MFQQELFCIQEPVSFEHVKEPSMVRPGLVHASRRPDVRMNAIDNRHGERCLIRETSQAEIA